MRLLRALLYLIECAAICLLLPSTGTAFLAAAAALSSAARAGDTVARGFLAGAIAFLPASWLLRRPLRFWYALGHELAHGVAAILLGGHPGDLEVRASGEGRVTFARAPVVLWLVLLAPYVVNPSYVVPAVVPWLVRDARAPAAVVAGFATAFALVSNALQVRSYQSDIRKAGLVRSLLFIAWGNLIASALAVALVVQGNPGAASVLRTAFHLELR